MLWWGYKHISGTYQAKPYREPLDIEEAIVSPFCKIVVPRPFEAKDRDEAIAIVKQKTDDAERFALQKLFNL